MHPIVTLQGALLGALNADPDLVTLIGTNAIFDAMPKGHQAPYGVIDRHDLRPRDGDLAPGFEHRLVLHFWHRDASRKAVLAIAERVTTVAVSAALSGGGLAVTHANVVRVETGIDGKTGQAKAVLVLRFLSEPG
ncbi:hypothetical protein VW29_15660 [Devosia limi DSM 17137]|uniref:DUF3168 domain-containing protein n=1 Tax=Devosia limi DSM 17137 TaxID=1121477 RepID=A0A0F5LM84_9HYPH|nr:DUF3168 domain-containing protein [Devosia limi]KKB82732.1 hypothetical protein VW29_15660 [Devosia limi DSM 17137]SHE39374.1 Protein of unknown function [Devosia limi DSM 17137]